MTDRIKEFLARNPEEGPRLVVDLEVVRENYLGFAKALPDTRVFYAVKANPAPEILDLLARLGACFDCASVPEIEQALAAGATPDRISFGNTIKKERDIARAYRARRAAVRGRLRGGGREDRARRAGLESVLPHPLRRRGRGMAAVAQVRLRAGDGRARARTRARLGLVAHGLSFHVGSQQRNPRMWDGALKASAAIFKDLAERGIELLDAEPRRRLPDPLSEGGAGGKGLRPHDLPRAAPAFRQPHPRDDHRARPRHGRQRRRHRGRGRADLEEVGRGRASLGLSRHRQVQRPRRDDGRDDPLSDPHASSTTTRAAPCVLAGPSCDSVDVLYEKEPYLLPIRWRSARRC